MRDRFAPLRGKTRGLRCRRRTICWARPARSRRWRRSRSSCRATTAPRWMRAGTRPRSLLSVVDRLVAPGRRRRWPRSARIGPERADLMLPGCAIFAAICALWPCPMLRVADRGLREGMLRQLRDELDAPEVRHETPGLGARRGARQGEEEPRSARPRRANGWRASSTIPMSMPPRRKAIAAAPPSS